MWWQELSLLSKILFCTASGTTIFMILQTILLLFGFGNSGDSFEGDDIDTDSLDMGDNDAEPYDGAEDSITGLGGMKLFTFRGIIAGLAIGCWAGFLMLSLGLEIWLSLLITVVVFFVVLVLYAWAFRSAMKLQQEGNIKIEQAVGKTATVYVPIQPNMEIGGKVTFVFQERFLEKDAICEEDTKIPVNQQVEIVGVTDNGVLIVHSLD
ncbi:MAG: NfeD family protein [Clostridia bacterium]|nr:NfeD family protein [Clostridia bacterium]